MLAASLLACSSDGDPTGDDFAETLSTLGGQTIDDTSVTHTPGDDTVTIGGLDVTLPQADELADMGSDILIPPGWPVLDQIEIRHPEAAEGLPRYAIVTFAQTELVTDDTTRRQLFDQAFAQDIEDDIPVVHSSTTQNAGTGTTCHTQVRAGELGRLFVAKAVTLISGPDIASSGIVAVRSGAGDTVPALAGDITEAACGERPEGL